MTNVPRMFIVLCERKVTFNIDSIEYVKSLKSHWRSTNTYKTYTPFQ